MSSSLFFLWALFGRLLGLRAVDPELGAQGLRVGVLGMKQLALGLPLGSDTASSGM